VPDLSSERIHASCVAIGGRGVLISGASNSGKSDLSLRLIDRGATLVSDDYTQLVRKGDQLIGSPPKAIAGKMEVRGIGIVEKYYLKSVTIVLLIDLDQPSPRFPDDDKTRTLAGVEIPLFTLAGLEPSAPIKVELLVSQL
jgi:serine kinase of HPr protein (carbohydrate metabolism regulator)